MRNLSENQLPLGVMCGTITVNGTHYSPPIDTRGFREVTAMLIAGANSGGAFGTGGNTGVLAVKFQEGDVRAGVAGSWTDITDGIVNGSMDFDDITLTAGTTYTAYEMISERFDDNNRSRFIRAYAALTGTDACNVTYSIGLLLGRPNDTLYIDTGNTSVTITGTANTEVS